MGKKFIILLVFVISCSGTSPIEENADTIDETPTTTSTIPIEEKLLIKDKKDGKKGVVRIVTKGIKVEESNDNKLVKTQGDSSGSGFFISSDGFIVTNNHVVGGAVTIDVYIGEERNSYKAKIVGTSECDDIAVLKINLPVGGAFYFEFDEINPVLGEDILAIGFPRGDEQITYLNGIVSKEKAEGSNQWSSIDYAFEHTAEILPGSSGGPIINNIGKVVGVAYAGNSDRQEFGIPSTVIKKTINEIINNTFYKTLGANAEQFLDFGLYIYSAEPNSPFDKAGFNGGELITHINGLDISKESTMDVYCSALQTRGDSAAINFKGFDIDEESDFEASVSLDGSKASFNLIKTTTTTKAPTTKAPTTTKAPAKVDKPYFSLEALGLYIDSFDDMPDGRNTYKRWRQPTILFGVVGNPTNDDLSVIRNLIAEFSRLISDVNFEYIDGVGDITYYFDSEQNLNNIEDCGELDPTASHAWWSGNTFTRAINCVPDFDYYKTFFDTEQNAKDCRVYSLRATFLWMLTDSWRNASSDIYGNNYFSRAYCNTFQKITELDKKVIEIHYSPYVINAKTINEVYNLLK